MSETKTKNRLMDATSLHELLKVAIEDFEKALENPNFRVQMSVWLLKPKEQAKNNPEVCFGCLAGATLIQEIPECESFIEVDPDFDPDIYEDNTDNSCIETDMELNITKLDEKYPGIKHRVLAINALRTGCVREATRLLYDQSRNLEGIEFDRITPFRYLQGGTDNRKAFLGDLWKLWQYLVEKDL
jgi:hypothetical protein